MKSLLKVIIVATALGGAMPGPVHAGEAASHVSETASAYYRAAVQGSPDAQANLGALYAKGVGVPQSDTAAFQWFMRAAEQGHGKAQVMLGEIWANGWGVPRNEAIAYKWATLAKANGLDLKTRDKADKLIDRLAQQMSDDQIAEARLWAAQWKPQREVAQSIQPVDAAKAGSNAEPDVAPSNRPQTSEKGVGPARADWQARAMRRRGMHSADTVDVDSEVHSIRRHIPSRLLRYARKLGL